VKSYHPSYDKAPYLINVLKTFFKFSRYLILKSGKTLVVPSPALTSLPGTEQDSDVFFHKIDGQALQVPLWARVYFYGTYFSEKL